MATIELAYVQRFKDRHGKIRHYFRYPGRKRTPLPGLPGSPEFMAAYQDATAALAQPTAGAGAPPKPGTIAALLVAYYASSQWKARDAQTQHTYRRILEKFREAHGDKRAAMLQPRHIKAILDQKADTPEAAQTLLKRLRGLFRFAMDRDLIGHDPTAGVRLARRKTAGFRPWMEEDIERFEAAYPSGSRQRLALALLLYTTQRRSDVVRLGRQHERGGVLRFRQQKAGPGAELLEVPIHPALQAELDQLPEGQMTYLVTAYGKPFSPAGFTNWFRDQAKAAGLPEGCSPHGLRKAGARRLAEAQSTTHEIAAITGHTTLKEVERYTRSANRGRLAASAMERLTNKDSQT